MRKSLYYCLIIICFLSIVGLVNAEESGGELIGKAGDCITLPQECADCSYIKVTSIQYPNLTREYVNIPMTKQGSSYNYTFCDTNSTGEYNYCMIGDVGGSDTIVCNDFLVTLDGNSLNIVVLIADIVLLIFIVVLMILIKNKHSKTDFNSNRKTIVKSDKKNGQKIVNGIIQSLFKNSFIWMYFMGWLAIMVLKDIVYRFTSLELFNYFTLIANIYSLGLILVLVYMIGYTINYMKEMTNMLSDNAWGVGE